MGKKGYGFGYMGGWCNRFENSWGRKNLDQNILYETNTFSIKIKNKTKHRHTHMAGREGEKEGWRQRDKHRILFYTGQLLLDLKPALKSC